MTDFTVCEGYYPGVLAECLHLHLAYYSREWDFGKPFETKLAREMGAFFENYSEGRDLFLSLRDKTGRAVATIALDGAHAAGTGAHLRWFIVSGEVRGLGLGSLLLTRAMGFCREHGYGRIYLTTFRGLDPARHLYEKHGFTLVSESGKDQWKSGVTEQLFRYTSDPS